ncbi:hypothetical protein P154DRAFT_520783 [Amniculicola lignicola CBS 123094]|uniref:Uncharacterized protein n=1 Tax=Amniculicola lignicola CBS 123094 TaxID=1392246 RepID=A0A6A5WU95_9PLEO|nr:hypothetical protein P154DRAFT_520783 [Amniculicola lignicola CBS 123094]
MSDAAIPQWSGPGIIQNFVTIPESSELSQEVFQEWVDNEYMPGLLHTGVVKSAWQFKAASPEYKWQTMFIYRVPDLAPIQAGKLQSVPRTSDRFPTAGPVDDFIEVETRIYSLAQLYETTKKPEDAATTIIMAGMEPTPGGEEDLEAWYRQEHNQQMSEQPGWVRTTRFKHIFQWRPDARKESDIISFLAIHEFGEGHKLGKNVEALDPITDWTKKCMSEVKAIDAAIFEKVRSYGKATTS